MRRIESRNRSDRGSAARKTARVAGAVLTVSHASGAAIAAGAALVITGGPAGASPMTFTVTNLNDAGTGSLRQAILDANANAGADTIVFQPGLTGTITLTTGELSVKDAVTIQGPGAGVISVSGNNASRVFYLYNTGSAFDVTISGLTITKGKAGSGAAIRDRKERLHLFDSVVTGNASTSGPGAIDVFYQNSTFEMRNTTVSGNIATGNGGGIGLFYVNSFSITGSTITGNQVTGTTSNGGGVEVYRAGAGTIVDTTISGNTARRGAGLAAFYSTDLTVRNSTISGNHATAGVRPGTGVGGGVDVADVDHVKFFNSTVSGNTATNGSGGFFLYSVPHLYLVESTVTANNGGGVNGQAVTGQHTQAQDPGPPNAGAAHPLHPHQHPAVHAAAATAVNLVGSILAGNTGSPDLANAGTVTSDHSLLGTKDAGTTVTDVGGTITGVAPQLGPLTNNGGPTQTHALLPGSPAIDAGPLTVPSFPGNQFDQRGVGFARVINGRVDIGAFEAQILVVTPRFTG